MRQDGSGAARTGHRLGSATLAFVVSIVALILAVAFMAATVYALLSPVTGSNVVPRSVDELRVLGWLSLLVGAFAVATATAEELGARRRETGEAPESLPGASRSSSASRSKARPATSR